MKMKICMIIFSIVYFIINIYYDSIRFLVNHYNRIFEPITFIP